MTEETTTEQLAEIEGQAESTPVTEYTPPKGWRLLAVGEVLRDGDMWVWPTNDQLRQTVHVGAVVGANQRYIRPIEPQPQPQPQPVQVREGRWRKRSGAEVSVSAMPTDHDDFTEAFPWWDGHETTWTQSGHLLSSGECPADLVEYLGPIKPEPQQVNDWPSVRDLRHELKTVQTQLGESRQRVTHLEELVTSLRTINETQEKAFTAAGKENTALKNQLAAVKAELASVAADRQRLRVELDAAHQVPADSPELRQLRADLAEVTQDRDTYRHAHELLLHEVNATHQRTKVMTIEAIVEWLVPIRTCGSQALATAVISNLPHIMRSLTGLEDEDIE